MNLVNRNCERSLAFLTIFRGTEVHGPHVHDQGRRSLQNSMQVLATSYIPTEHMILNGIVNGYMSELKSPRQPRTTKCELFILCVQIKGGHQIGHLIESNLSWHTVILHINGSLKRFHSLQLSYTNDGNMDTVWRRVYDTYPRDSG